MRNLAIIGLFIGIAFFLLGYFARTPGQEALSNAVIAIGVALILFVGVIAVTSFVIRARKEWINRS